LRPPIRDKSEECFEHNTGIVVLDFDGVLNTYDGTNFDPDDLLSPREGAIKFVNHLVGSGLTPVVLSTRESEKVNKWLSDNGFIGVLAVDKKPPALCYVDDRGINFSGNYDDLLSQIKAFRAYWE
jgi:hypothetical protein